MKKIAIVVLVLAILCAAAAFQFFRWETATETQQEMIQKDLEQAAETLRHQPELWTNEAAEEALKRERTVSGLKAMDEYVSPEGIRFVSDSEQWDASMLEELYQELLRNKHGDELNTLDKVTVHGEADAFAAATHGNMTEEIPFSLSFPLLSDRPICTFVQNFGKIDLYDGDRKTTVEEMAADLSHEYGHHFVLSHMLKGDGSDADAKSEYAKLRELDFSKVHLSADSPRAYYEQHSWMLMEIAAEDYVVLMGSPDAMKETGIYRDIRGQMKGEKSDTTICRNAAPQENMFLPFATQVPGLADYFYSFVDDDAPEYPDASKLELKFERHTGGYRQISGYQSFRSYEISWDKVFGEQATYTLVCLDPANQRVIPLLTVEADEDPVAEIGSVPTVYRSLVTWHSDGIGSGDKLFYVVVTLPDGRVAVSEPVEQSL